tara:strand:+ start:115 stop:303 length:189 start_codon:yes stop_codon:yes gene_type:complete
MTKKDYVKIAKAINNNSYSATKGGMSYLIIEENLINALCTIFKEDNPNFDRARFLTACNEEG